MSNIQDTNVREMSMAEFVDKGFIQEINRLLLHPAGLSLEISPSTTDDGSWDVQILDKRRAPQELRLDGPTTKLVKKALMVSQMRSHASEERVRLLGYEVQPLAVPRDRPKDK